MRVEPVLNRVLVLVEEFERKTESGIYIPETVAETHEARQEVGEVLAFGPLAYYDCGGPENAGVKEGDKVLFARLGGKSVVYGDLDKRLRLLNDEDIQAVVKEDSDAA